MPTHPESIAYIKFLEQSGIECVATFMRWAFFRRKSSEGAFDMYSDIESKIKHFKRINLLWTTLMIVELSAGLANLIIGVVNKNIDEKLGNFSVENLIIGSSLLLLGLFFWKLGTPIRKKIKKLQREKDISE